MQQVWQHIILEDRTLQNNKICFTLPRIAIENLYKTYFFLLETHGQFQLKRIGFVFLVFEGITSTNIQPSHESHSLHQ